jgi:hypothetical protein
MVRTNYRGINYHYHQGIDMIELQDLEGIKLVTDRGYIASDQEVRQAVETAFQQGSQGWGVNQKDAVLLALAENLRDALLVSTEADDNFRLLKGCQMEGGRLKKRIAVLEGLEAVYQDSLASLAEVGSDLARANDKIDSLSALNSNLEDSRRNLALLLSDAEDEVALLLADAEELGVDAPG